MTEGALVGSLVLLRLSILGDLLAVALEEVLEGLGCHSRPSLPEDRLPLLGPLTSSDVNVGDFNVEGKVFRKALE